MIRSDLKPAVFIPCYNALNTIGETLSSIEKAMQVYGANMPIYIYDDKSSDGTMSFLKTFAEKNKNIQIVSNEVNLGERRTTNIAFKDMAKQHNWVFMIHADDIVKPDWLTVLAEEICKSQDDVFTVWSSFDTFTMVNGEVGLGDNSGDIQRVKRDQLQARAYLEKVHSSWHISGAAFSIPHFLEIHGFDERMAQFGDTDFFVRGMLAGFSDVYISRTLTSYRILDTSVSAVSTNTNRDIREVYMLINKFSDLLTDKEKGKMLSYCIRVSLNRALKSFMHLNLKKTAFNLHYFFNAVYKRVIII